MSCCCCCCVRGVLLGRIDAMLEVAKAKAAEKRVMCDAACTSAFNKLQAKLKQRKADDVSAEDKKKL